MWGIRILVDLDLILDSNDLAPGPCLEEVVEVTIGDLAPDLCRVGGIKGGR